MYVCHNDILWRNGNYGTVLCNIMLCYAVCVQYHAVLCNIMQYYAVLCSINAVSQSFPSITKFSA